MKHLMDTRYTHHDAQPFSCSQLPLGVHIYIPFIAIHTNPKISKRLSVAYMYYNPRRTYHFARTRYKCTGAGEKERERSKQKRLIKYKRYDAGREKAAEATLRAMTNLKEYGRKKEPQ